MTCPPLNIGSGVPVISTCMKESKPQNIDELVDHVSDYAMNIPRQVVFKAVKDIYIRAGCCLDNGGGE